MDKRKLNRLQAAGWKVGDASDFLELSVQERKFIEYKIDLANRVKVLRQKQGLTQVEVARAIGSSQSRIAKLEAADSSVSTDLMLKSLFMLGASKEDIPVATASRKPRQKKTA